MASNANGAKEPSTGKFGRYVAHHLLGVGGMGRVYLAKDPVLQREVAVKVISLDTQLDDITRRDYLSRFSMEARASAKLNHQSIVTVYDAGEENGVPWIAFEFVDGERLDKLLKHEGRFPVNEAVSIALDIAAALHHAHSHSIIHRDIKPSNILIERSTGIAKLADFGIVKAPWTVLTQQGDVVGSPGYMSPEQINGFELDGRTDLFSLGVVFYEMIAGKHPFLRETVQSTLMATLSGTSTSLTELCRNLPHAVESTISKCLKADRDKRIPSAEEFTSLLTSHPSLATYQSHGSREALGGMAQKIAQALKKGTLNSHTKHLLHAKFEGARKFYWFLLELAEDCLQIILSFAKPVKAIASFPTRLLHRVRSPSMEKTRTVSVPYHAKVKRDILAKMLDAQVHVLSKLRKLIQSFPWRTRNVAVVVTVAVIGVLVPVLWSIGSNIKIAVLKKRIREGTLAQAVEAAQELDKRGISWPEYELINRCRALLDQANIELAALVAQEITELEPNLPHGHILVGRVALKSGEYDKARKAFVLAKEQENGRAALKQEHIHILADLGQELMHSQAQQSLVRMASAILSPDDEPLISSWLQSKNYWLRWNSVRILRAGNKPVDMVNVYVFDLKYCANVETRIRAAHKLGELGDRRAVSALEEAASKQKSDPMVARIARSVLKKYYR